LLLKKNLMDALADKAALLREISRLKKSAEEALLKVKQFDRETKIMLEVEKRKSKAIDLMAKLQGRCCQLGLTETAAAGTTGCSCSCAETTIRSCKHVRLARWMDQSATTRWMEHSSSSSSNTPTASKWDIREGLANQVFPSMATHWQDPRPFVIFAKHCWLRGSTPRKYRRLHIHNSPKKPQRPFSTIEKSPVTPRPCSQVG
jgi:hypothetical protein